MGIQTEPVKILGTAKSYMMAADRCDERRPTGPGVVDWLPIPAAVLFAFSAELSLKALVAHHGGLAPREHRLDRLFNLLPHASRLRIADGLKISLPLVRSQLRQVASVFVEWRYLHEKLATDPAAHLSVGFIRKMARETYTVGVDLIGDPSKPT